MSVRQCVWQGTDFLFYNLQLFVKATYKGAFSRVDTTQKLQESYKYNNFIKSTELLNSASRATFRNKYEIESFSIFI